jgi:hypothetical protein
MRKSTENLEAFPAFFCLFKVGLPSDETEDPGRGGQTNYTA